MQYASKNIYPIFIHYISLFSILSMDMGRVV